MYLSQIRFWFSFFILIDSILEILFTDYLPQSISVLNFGLYTVIEKSLSILCVMGPPIEL